MCVYNIRNILFKFHAQINLKAAEWVRENAFKKGEPNMTARSFCFWVNDELLPSCNLPPQYPRCISVATARRWLHHLGFSPRSHRKGVYIDGHEREDVVEHRKVCIKLPPSRPFPIVMLTTLSLCFPPPSPLFSLTLCHPFSLHLPQTEPHKLYSNQDEATS